MLQGVLCQDDVWPIRISTRRLHEVMAYETQLETEPAADRRVDNRRTRSERRAGSVTTAYEGQERRAAAPRRKVERRRQIDPTTCERDYSADEIDFMRAMDDYKRRSGRQFPTWSEVLEVVRSMGYRKVSEPTDLQM
jgi:hypothetical protein